MGQWGAEAVLGTGGTPATSTPVNVYETGTTTPVSLYTDITGATGASNPVSTTSLGDLTFFCQAQVVDLNFTVGGIPTTLTVVVYPSADSGWVAFSGYVNSWASNGGPASGAAGYRIVGNRVELGGSISGGVTGTDAFTLPAAAFPPYALNLPGQTIATAPYLCNFTVSTGGVVQPKFAGGTIPCLDGLHFLTS